MVHDGSLPIEIREPLEQWLEAAIFSTGSVVFRQGDPSDGCYFVESGVARVELEDYDIDSEPVLGYFGSGEVIGELGFLDRQPRSASVLAEDGPLVTSLLSSNALAKMTDSDPLLAAQVYRYLGRVTAERLRFATDRTSRGPGDEEVGQLVAEATAAQREFATWTDERVTALLSRIAGVAADRAKELAQLTVEVTRIGNASDKTEKNRMASLGVFEFIRDQPTTGILETDSDTGVSKLVSAVGVVFALVPQTNPVATAIFKALIALKARNSLILSFHRSARAVAEVVGEMLDGVCSEVGAPHGLISWVKNRNSRRKTESFFRHEGVSLILATGGRSMVRAAYSSGRPAIGVGPGNTPVLVCDDCILEEAAAQIVLSKSFDNGLICGAEHNLVVVDAVYDRFVRALEAAGAAVFVGADERERLLHTAFVDDKGLRRRVVGSTAAAIGEQAGIDRDYQIRVLVVPSDQIDASNPLAREKLAPILGLFRVADTERGIAACQRLLEIDGAGHTAGIHTASRMTMERFAVAMPVGRILANTPTAHGAVGLTTGLVPSLTLGCGTFGGTSTTDNVTFSHLLNTKRLAEGRPPAPSRNHDDTRP